MSCSVKFFEPTVMARVRGVQPRRRRATGRRERCGGPVIGPADQQLLDSAEAEVGDERHQRRRNGAGEDDAVVDHRDAAKDELAEAAGADRGRDGRDPDGDDGGDADSRQHHRQRQRQLDLPEKLARGEAHRDGGFADRRADAGDPDIGVANDGQQRVQRERDDGQTVGTRAQPGQRQQQSEERQAGNGLDDIGAAQHQRLPTRPAGEQNAERHSDGDGQQHRDPDQPQVFGGQGRNFALVGEEEVQSDFNR